MTLGSHNQHKHDPVQPRGLRRRFYVLVGLRADHPAHRREVATASVEIALGRALFTYDDGLELDWDLAELGAIVDAARGLDAADAGRLRAA